MPTSRVPWPDFWARFCCSSCGAAREQPRPQDSGPRPPQLGCPRCVLGPPGCGHSPALVPPCTGLLRPSPAPPHLDGRPSGLACLLLAGLPPGRLSLPVQVQQVALCLPLLLALGKGKPAWVWLPRHPTPPPGPLYPQKTSYPHSGSSGQGDGSEPQSRGLKTRNRFGPLSRDGPGHRGREGVAQGREEAGPTGVGHGLSRFNLTALKPQVPARPQRGSHPHRPQAWMPAGAPGWRLGLGAAGPGAGTSAGW